MTKLSLASVVCLLRTYESVPGDPPHSFQEKVGNKNTPGERCHFAGNTPKFYTREITHSQFDLIHSVILFLIPFTPLST